MSKATSRTGGFDISDEFGNIYFGESGNAFKKL